MMWSASLVRHSINLYKVILGHMTHEQIFLVMSKYFLPKPLPTVWLVVRFPSAMNYAPNSEVLATPSGQR